MLHGSVHATFPFPVIGAPDAIPPSLSVVTSSYVFGKKSLRSPVMAKLAPVSKIIGHRCVPAILTCKSIGLSNSRPACRDTAGAVLALSGSDACFDDVVLMICILPGRKSKTRLLPCRDWMLSSTIAIPIGEL